MNLLELPVNWVLSSLALLAAPKVTGGIQMKDARTAFKTTLIYGLLSTVGSWLLLSVLFPLALLPVWMFRFIAFFIVGVPALYLTELFVSGFEVDDLKAAARAALLAVVVQTLFWVLAR